MAKKFYKKSRKTSKRAKKTHTRGGGIFDLFSSKKDATTQSDINGKTQTDIDMNTVIDDVYWKQQLFILKQHVKELQNQLDTTKTELSIKKIENDDLNKELHELKKNYNSFTEELALRLDRTYS